MDEVKFQVSKNWMWTDQRKIEERHRWTLFEGILTALWREESSIDANKANIVSVPSPNESPSCLQPESTSGSPWVSVEKHLSGKNVTL